MARPSLAKIAKAKALAEAGIDYSPRSGATCPWCGQRTRIYRTLPWDESTRIRYHRCETRGCVLHSMQVSIKSIEADYRQD